MTTVSAMLPQASACGDGSWRSALGDKFTVEFDDGDAVQVLIPGAGGRGWAELHGLGGGPGVSLGAGGGPGGRFLGGAACGGLAVRSGGSVLWSDGTRPRPGRGCGAGPGRDRTSAAPLVVLG